MGVWAKKLNARLKIIAGIQGKSEDAELHQLNIDIPSKPSEEEEEKMSTFTNEFPSLLREKLLNFDETIVERIAQAVLNLLNEAEEQVHLSDIELT